VRQYCGGCHNAKTQTGGLSLENVDRANPAANAEIFEKVIKKLESRSMPPFGRPRPDEQGYWGLISYLEESIDRAAQNNPNPGRPSSVHRLNRIEYANAIRDLLLVNIDAPSSLPPDDANDGF
jgi:hypothetical protein